MTSAARYVPRPMFVREKDLRRVTGLRSSEDIAAALSEAGIAFGYQQTLEVYTTERHMFPDQFQGTYEAPGPLYPFDLVLTLDQVLCLPQEIDNLSGVYFFILDGEVVYVGKALDFSSRYKRHDWDRRSGHRYAKEWDSVRFLHADAAIIDWIEDNHIRAYRPRFNIMGCP